MSHPDGEIGRASPGTSGVDQFDAVRTGCTLEAFARQDGCQEGVAIALLEAGTTLVVCTHNSRYRLTVLDGAGSTVLVDGGCRFPKATEALLQGASSGGSLLKTGWIGVGLRVELCVGPRRIVTSPVRSITIENRPPVLATTAWPLF